ncbi:hypothetical protein EMCRGX_G031549 [Ephydatia muelleri]|eukprot:Em0018g418a
MNCLGRKLFQVRHIKRFRRVVCTCEGINQSQFPPQSSNEELRHWLNTVSDGIVPQGAKKVLQNMLSTSDPALLNVVTLIRQASVGNLQRLEPAYKPNMPVPSSEPVVLEDRMQLDFPAAYLGLLMGRSGTHIKALCQQHKVAVHFTGEEEGKGKESHVAGSAVWVVVKHKLGSSIEEFKEQLKQNAEKVVKNRKKHEISVLVHLRKRAERRQMSKQKNAQAGATRISAGVYNTPKEAAIGHFEKKSTKHSKRSIPTVPFLTDGHCLQCGAPFDRQSNAGCVYHSGYLVVSETTGKHEWSCCHLETEEVHADLEVHKTTGCCKGLHTWRPAKGVRRKHNKEPMKHISDGVLQ